MATVSLAALLRFLAVFMSIVTLAETNSTYTNPILPGFHPDPSCIYVPEWNSTWFCASSSFNAFPGIPIHASKDLKNWKLITNVLNRQSQLLDLALTNSSTAGIWAPTIRYYNGCFYIVTTLVQDDRAVNDSSRWDNIIFRTSDPYNSTLWSDPVHFNFTGYDTSPFWDKNGTSYIVGSHAWRIYPSIQLAQVDLNTGKTSEWQTIWTGTGGEAPEGPHIYYKDGLYYTMIAEGGTGSTHMETIARSSSLFGPYISNPANPILTAANTTRFFQTVGHADIFQDTSGNWWAVALATRQGTTSSHPMGRETVLTPCRWETGEWPVCDPVYGTMEGWSMPVTNKNIDGFGRWITDRDDVDFAPGSQLPLHFTHWRFPQEDSYAISPSNHPYTLQLNPSLSNLTGYDGRSALTGQSVLLRRQEDTLFTYSILMDYSPTADDEEAGITVFLQQDHHVEIGVVKLSTSLIPYVRVRGYAKLSPIPDTQEVLPKSLISQQLRLEIRQLNWTHYALSYGPADEIHLMKTLAYVLTSSLSAGFTGTLIGVYATSNGGSGSTPVYFSKWSYQGNGQYRT